MPDLTLDYWEDYSALMQRLGLGTLAPGQVPGTEALNVHIPVEVEHRTGRSLRFVSADSLPGVNYEQHIFECGEISTRQDNWHDLFNALVWSRYPRIKTTMNAMHHAEMAASNTSPVDAETPTGRGAVRDALTLFDECGVVVVSNRRDPLEALVQRDWQKLFLQYRQDWEREIQVFVLGHALLEKFLQPYKAITGQALVFLADDSFARRSREEQRDCLDMTLAEQIKAAVRLRSSRELSPLQLMGIPGWWGDEPQDATWYADRQVFRAPVAGLEPAPIHILENAN